MPGLVPGIHVLLSFKAGKKGVDGRNKSGHDGVIFARVEVYLTANGDP
jgi:hypothetical protein